MKAGYVFFLAITLFALTTQTVPGQNDFKIKQRMTVAGQSFDSSVMVKGSRQRHESDATGTQSISIMQCDLKRSVDVSDAEKKYFVTPMDTPLPSESAKRVSTTTTRQPVRSGGVVTQTIELIDTGERKQMFGLTARHMKTITTIESSPDACRKGSQRIETDGWYADLTFGITCHNDRPMSEPVGIGGGGCRDKMNVVRKGSAKLGFPLLQTTKIGMGGGDDKGAMTSTMKTEVLELSKTTLPAALFDIPAGYAEASSRQELYRNAMQRQYARPTPAENSSAVPMPGMTNVKRPGVMRVGVMPVTNSTARVLALDMYRSHLVSSLSIGNVDAVQIGSEADAGRLNCDFILTTNVKDLKQSAASKAGGILGNVTGTSNGGPAKVESVVAYTLSKPGGGPLLTSESTAKVEGDDASVIASLATEVQNVRSFVAKGR
ncbi:MAG: hypothetical protein ABI791_06600 [Acidobacteriota bacterium]